MANAVFEGNLTRDPELRFLPSGKPVCDFSVAVNRRWKDQAGEQQEEVSFFDCTAWDELGENVAHCLAKGDRVLVSARIRQRSWEAEDGTKRSKVEFTVDCVGPSLRWATTQITKTAKKEGGAAPAGHTPAQPAYADDEPF